MCYWFQDFFDVSKSISFIFYAIVVMCKLLYPIVGRKISYLLTYYNILPFYNVKLENINIVDCVMYFLYASKY